MDGGVPVEDPSAVEQLLRRGWSWHDARWFEAVAAEFGVEAANRLNHRIVRWLGRTEMRRLMDVCGVIDPGDLEGVLRLITAALRVYLPASLLDATVSIAAEDAYDLVIRRCYVHENVMWAGLAGAYECAVFDRVHGWHDALGLDVEGDASVRTCDRAALRDCSRRIKLARGAQRSTPSPG